MNFISTIQYIITNKTFSALLGDIAGLCLCGILTKKALSIAKKKLNFAIKGSGPTMLAR